MRRMLIALAAVLAIGGCGDGDDGAGTATDGGGTTETAATGTTAPGLELTARCTSEEDGYAVSYPGGWHQERCAYFDPRSFEVPEATEFFDVAVLADRAPVGLDVFTGEDRTREIVLREDIRVAGRDAVLLEAVTTGEGLLDAGVRYYQVAVSADGEVVVLSTYDLPGLEYERNKEVVDAMARTLQLF